MHYVKSRKGDIKRYRSLRVRQVSHSYLTPVPCSGRHFFTAENTPSLQIGATPPVGARGEVYSLLLSRSQRRCTAQRINFSVLTLRLPKVALDLTVAASRLDTISNLALQQGL